LYVKGKMIELVLTGSPYERGMQHGQMFVRETQAAVGLFREEIGDVDASAIADATAAFLDSLFPEINEEIRGIADGTACSFRDLFLFNNRAMLAHKPAATCSNLAVQTADGVVIGMNKDRPLPAPPYDTYVIKKVTPHQGHAFIGYGHVGRTWGHGMNEKGLCTAGTAAYPLQPLSPAPSFGSYLLPGILLTHCADVPEALDMIAEISPISDAGNFMLCDAAGKMAVVELAPNKCCVRKAVENRIVSTNFYASGEIDHRNNPDHLRRNKQRYDAIDTTLAGKTNPSVESVRDILSGHGGDSAVCRHSECEESTVLSWMAMPSTGDFYICEGTPCEHDFIPHRLSEKRVS
jgi:isopenicillin-N N-acyltransferase-like protein